MTQGSIQHSYIYLHSLYGFKWCLYSKTWYIFVSNGGLFFFEFQPKFSQIHLSICLEVQYFGINKVLLFFLDSKHHHLECRIGQRCFEKLKLWNVKTLKD